LRLLLWLSSTIMSATEDHGAAAGASSARLLYSLDADTLCARLAQATPPPDDKQDRLNDEARSLLVRDGCVACELEACRPYWNLLQEESTGVYCAQWSLWQAFRDHQQAQRKHLTTQKLERAIRARRRQWSLQHVSVRLLPEVQRQCRLQTWVEFQDLLLQRQAEGTAALEERAASNTAWSQRERGRLTVLNGCFGANVLPWTEKIRLGLAAGSVGETGAAAKGLRLVSRRFAPTKAQQPAMARQTRRTTTRRVQRGRGCAGR